MSFASRLSRSSSRLASAVPRGPELVIGQHRCIHLLSAVSQAVEAGLVHRELFKRHSGQDFEQWIKQGLSAFDIEMTAEARDLARADIGTAAERAAVDSVPS
eukprot:GHUV01053220.1.p2 GENE.GHUV01053220.1~~GHUV01053220.1.p2  ORF type:complete len:102 (-),score=18.27 GHUV01053220.1:70-375(-)